MKIRSVEENDLKDALNLVWDTFNEFEAPNYSKLGIEEFKKFISYESVVDRISKNELIIWGYFENDKLLGVIATRDISHICMLFVSSTHHKKGIAKDLFLYALDKIRFDSSVKKITVNSSIYGRQFYQRIGFIEVDKELTVNGIRFIPMVYPL